MGRGPARPTCGNRQRRNAVRSRFEATQTPSRVEGHNELVDLPVMPPVPPMLSKSIATIPEGAFYEPKWDGFRSICFRDGDEVEFGSRNERPLTRYFPELVQAARIELPPRCVVDGEIIIATRGRLNFEALQQRIHPAESRVRTLANTTPASFIAFDLLALGNRDLTGEPFEIRRVALVDALAGNGESFHVTPATTDPATARRWFDELEAEGFDGVIAKPPDAPYLPDKRSIFKIKHQRTAECVVAGYRLHKSGGDAIGSLLLGLYRSDGTLVPVGVIGAFPLARRREIFAELQSLATGFDEHPWHWADQIGGDRQQSRWNAGKALSFVPVRPERVVEVRYDHMEGDRFRHTAQFNRWRPDRDPRSCTYEQLPTPTLSGSAGLISTLLRQEHS